MALHFTATYGGLSGLDHLDVTDRLTVTGGGRINVARSALQDRVGTSLDGDDTFTRFDPLVGATYRLTPEITGHASCAEANLRQDRFYACASCAFVDATFRTPILLSSPDNPFADEGSDLRVRGATRSRWCRTTGSRPASTIM